MRKTVLEPKKSKIFTFWPLAVSLCQPLTRINMILSLLKIYIVDIKLEPSFILDSNFQADG